MQVHRKHLEGKPRLALELRGSAKRHQGDVVPVRNSERSKMDDYLTIQEVAALYAVSEKTVRNWVSQGRLDARRIGGRVIRIEARSLETLSEPVNYRGYVSRSSRNFKGRSLFMRFE